MKRERAAALLRSCVMAATFAWIGVVSARRAVALSTGLNSFDASGEARWMQWAYREPRLLDALARAQQKIRPSDAVVAVCDSASDAFWYLAMSQYGLPQQVVVGARAEGTLGRARAVRVRMSGGGAEVIPRPGGGSPDGPR